MKPKCHGTNLLQLFTIKKDHINFVFMLNLNSTFNNIFSSVEAVEKSIVDSHCGNKESGLSLASL